MFGIDRLFRLMEISELVVVCYKRRKEILIKDLNYFV
jgi:hypothetical protein